MKKKKLKLKYLKLKYFNYKIIANYKAYIKGHKYNIYIKYLKITIFLIIQRYKNIIYLYIKS